jgi:protein tyrosine/serine phosphatase
MVAQPHDPEITLSPDINWKRWGKWTGLFVLITGLAVGGYVLNAVVHHNFHTVSAGRVYRSAQMDADSLEKIVREHGIKTIINLRGAPSRESWYSVETNTARELGVQHYDFSLSASREVRDDEMDQILATIRTAPKPALIHCKSGSDRTGLVGALYLYSVEGQTARSADRQLNPFYGHIPFLFWRGSAAMDRSYWRYVHNHSRLTKPTPEAIVASNPVQ